MHVCLFFLLPSILSFLQSHTGCTPTGHVVQVSRHTLFSDFINMSVLCVNLSEYCSLPPWVTGELIQNEVLVVHISSATHLREYV